ncbi:MAG: TRAP transporter small permease [Deltaproteobacteria bacterium]|nr:TRAP transporter small permease [Deltaproteobacteria bacterium]
MPRPLRFLDNLLARIEKGFLVLFLGLMVVLTFLQVALRALYTQAHMEWANALMGHIAWTEPLVRLLVLWVTFLGASLLTREGKHIKIDLMPGLLPARWLRYRGLLLSLACILVTALMLLSSVAYIRMEIAFGAPAALGIPGWVGPLILPVGFSLILLRFLLRGLDQVSEILRRKAL